MTEIIFFLDIETFTVIICIRISQMGFNNMTILLSIQRNSKHYQSNILIIHFPQICYILCKYITESANILNEIIVHIRFTPRLELITSHNSGWEFNPCANQASIFSVKTHRNNINGFLSKLNPIGWIGNFYILTIQVRSYPCTAMRCLVGWVQIPFKC